MCVLVFKNSLHGSWEDMAQPFSSTMGRSCQSRVLGDLTPMPLRTHPKLCSSRQEIPNSLFLHDAEDMIHYEYVMKYCIVTPKARNCTVRRSETLKVAPLHWSIESKACELKRKERKKPLQPSTTCHSAGASGSVLAPWLMRNPVAPPSSRCAPLSRLSSHSLAWPECGAAGSQQEGAQLCPLPPHHKDPVRSYES